MNHLRIPWVEILSQYPGETLAARFSAMRQGRTYKEVAQAIGCTESAVKTFVSSKVNCWWIPDRQRYEYIVRNRIRPNYKIMMETLLEQLGKEVGLSPDGFRTWIEWSTAGAQFFESRCQELRFPVFRCRRSTDSC